LSNVLSRNSGSSDGTDLTLQSTLPTTDESVVDNAAEQAEEEVIVIKTAGEGPKVTHHSEGFKRNSLHNIGERKDESKPTFEEEKEVLLVDGEKLTLFSEFEGAAPGLTLVSGTPNMFNDDFNAPY